MANPTAAPMAMAARDLRRLPPPDCAGRCGSTCSSPPSPTQTRLARRKTKGRQIALPPRRLERMTYFRLVIAVRSAESLTMPAAPHQFEPNPLGLIAVTKPGLELVVL